MIALEDITVRFGAGQALRGVNLDLSPGERVGIVGESGSGKTLVGLTMMGMLPKAASATGTIMVDGQVLGHASDEGWRKLRARRLAMVFQEPMAALNPLRRVGDTVAEPLRLHFGLSRDAARARVLDLFAETGLPEPEAKFRQFPHELSGGQRQRVLIALALSCNPGLLIADEPTTALDAHVALRITNLLVRLARDRDMALLFISHDIAAVARTVETLCVMYGGEIVEQGPVAQVLEAPRHPYTQGLLAAQPSLKAGQLRKRLPVIRGNVPAMQDLPAGCRFSGRCDSELSRCRAERPVLRHMSDRHHAACHLLDGPSS